MFESNEFLDCYLPQHLDKIVVNSSVRNPSQTTPLSRLKAFIHFIKMAHQLYLASSTAAHLEAFLLRQFPPLSQLGVGVPNAEMRKKLGLLDWTIDQVNLINIQIQQLSFCLFLKLIHINCHLLAHKTSQQKKQNFANELIQVSTQMRLAYELSCLSGSNPVEFDEYTHLVMAEFIPLAANDMQPILLRFASSQESNISGKIKQYILDGIQESPKTQDRAAFSLNKKDVCSVLRKSKKGSNYLQTTPMKKKEARGEKLGRRGGDHSISPLRDDCTRRKELPSPAKRIQVLARSKKVKPIQKLRTIYFERKNVYHQKSREWLSPHCLVSETSVGSSERLAGGQNLREDIVVDEFEEESVLVRSTPKISRKIQLRAISHRLEF